MFLGGGCNAWGVCKVTLVKDMMVKFSNVTFNVVSHSNMKWWPDKFLDREVILEI